MPLLRGPYNARPPAGAAPHSGGRRRKRAGLELLLRNPLFFLIFAVRVSQKFCRATVAPKDTIALGAVDVEISTTPSKDLKGVEKVRQILNVDGLLHGRLAHLEVIGK